MAEQPIPGASMGFVGRWRIVEMELWDADAFDLVGPAFIEFGSDLRGRFRFIVVDGWMDCRIAKQSGGACVEFSWEGSDEGDEVSGRGWAAVVDDGVLDGRIFFHNGDDSGFRAVRAGGVLDVGRV
ncbi:hypothetical protein [Pseudosporangium ferrugineum]|uniref:Uncharacterized protein n=1 Tax=Pseudosporangium ferrugineum TaxID=439699 RepID=A0A2T0R625_9ACTN|nr:hypothetical protein [Pseudosporangium ferrugineum]PRY16570.1 hypothetical protein CLV70_1637 [Pseudosporangium ferrugineum]